MKQEPNAFQSVWDELVAPETIALRLREIHEMGYEEFRRKVLAQDPAFIQTVPRNLYAGDVYFIRGAFSKDFIRHMKLGAVEFSQRCPSSFHKIVEGCPDFHRRIDEAVSSNYKVKGLKHGWYFFPWNRDPLGLFPTIWERWGLVKLLSGQRRDEYVHNTPKDGIVDRIQIVRYPAGAGMLEPHSDPYTPQLLINPIYMSRRGEDFETGGFYMVGRDGQRVDMEPHIGVGDMLVTFPPLLHGVEVIDGHKPVDWDSMDGRWYLSLCSAVSDEVKNRNAQWEALELAKRLTGDHGADSPFSGVGVPPAM